MNSRPFSREERKRQEEGAKIEKEGEKGEASTEGGWGQKKSWSKLRPRIFDSSAKVGKKKTLPPEKKGEMQGGVLMAGKGGRKR